MVTAPAAWAAAREAYGPGVRPSLRTAKRLVKSTLPRASPMGGMMTSLTSEFTTKPKAMPTIMPTAMSITLPFIMNALKSFNIFAPSSPVSLSSILQRRFQIINTLHICSWVFWDALPVSWQLLVSFGTTRQIEDLCRAQESDMSSAWKYGADLGYDSAPRGIRTHDPRFRRPVLLSAEL